MPTYEYRCPDGHEFEKFTQKMSDAQGELACPTCGKLASRRMSAGGGLLFKGSGFYITDYGKDGKKDQRAASAKSDAASSGAASGASSGASNDSSGAATPSTPAAPSAPAPSAPSAPSASKPKTGTDQ